MPRKRKSTTGASDEVSPEKKPAPTRRSTRIAEAADKKPASPLTSPSTQPTKRGRKKKESQSEEEASTSMDHSLNESVDSNAAKVDEDAGTSKPSPKKAKLSPKKQKGKQAQEPADNKETPVTETSAEAEPASETKEETNDTGADNQEKDEADFVQVSAADVPAPESNEVQAAIAAQGEDGQLLVGYVQLVRDEVPADDSSEVRHAVAMSTPPVSTDTAAPTLSADADKASVKPEEPAPPAAELTNGGDSSPSQPEGDVVTVSDVPKVPVPAATDSVPEEKVQE